MKKSGIVPVRVGSVAAATAIFSPPQQLPPPSALGTTTLPRVKLSYRWTVDNAEFFMKHGMKANVQNDIVVKSPAFTTKPTQPTLVVRSSFGHASSTTTPWSKWCLCLKKNYNGSFLSLEAQLADNWKNTKVVVSDCKFSFLDSSTSEVKYSKMAPLTECHHHDYNHKDVEIELPKIFTSESYMCNGALTIQVDATLLEVSRPNETVNKTREVPMDSIRSEMHTLFKESVLTDTTIKCRNKKFLQVHKAILVLQSPVFRKMFETDMKEKKTQVIDLSDYPQPVVSELVTYLYTGSAPNVGSLANNLINVANMYELRRLFVMCENELIMKIKVSEIVDLIILADKVKAQHLKRACMNFIRLNLAEIQKTVKWNELKSKEQYKDLIIETFEYSTTIA